MKAFGSISISEIRSRARERGPGTGWAKSYVHHSRYYKQHKRDYSYLYCSQGCKRSILRGFFEGDIFGHHVPVPEEAWMERGGEVFNSYWKSPFFFLESAEREGERRGISPTTTTPTTHEVEGVKKWNKVMRRKRFPFFVSLPFILSAAAIFPVPHKEGGERGDKSKKDAYTHINKINKGDGGEREEREEREREKQKQNSSYADG